MAGSALLKDEPRVAAILEAVVNSVEVPVTLKTRTGWDIDNRNVLRIARIAEDAGVQALAIHGRTRSCGYKGVAEYDTIADVKSRITIPVIANGDIDSPQKAKFVMDYTGVDAIMIGRAAQGRPWIFREIDHYLKTGEVMAAPGSEEINKWLQQHLMNVYDFYGEHMGVRIARKHIGWYCKEHPDAEDFRKRINQVEDPRQQLDEVMTFFHNKWQSETVKSAA